MVSNRNCFATQCKYHMKYWKIHWQLMCLIPSHIIRYFENFLKHSVVCRLLYRSLVISKSWPQYKTLYSTFLLNKMNNQYFCPKWKWMIFFIRRPISPARRRASKRRASHFVARASTLSRSASNKSDINVRKRCNSMSRIEQDSFDSEDIDLSFGQASETDDADDIHSIKGSKNQHNSNEKSKSQLCIHDKKQIQFDQLIENKKKEIQLPPPCKCRWFGNAPKPNDVKPVEVRIVSSLDRDELSPLIINHNTKRMATSKPSTSGTVTFVKNASPTSDVIQMGSSAPTLHLLAPNCEVKCNSTTPTPATSPTPAPIRKLSFSTNPQTKSSSVVTW